MYYARDSVTLSTAARPVTAKPAAARPVATRPAAIRAAERKPMPTAVSPEQPRHVVQLSLSSAPFDPARIPHLDIFDLYHLYTEATLEHGRVRHTLRLGFFKHAPTARTIARYLESYFDSPCIVRIDAAEVVRSLQHRIAPRKDIGASGLHAVIELTAPAELPTAELTPPTRAASPDRAPRTSLWARLFG